MNLNKTILDNFNARPKSLGEIFFDLRGETPFIATTAEMPEGRAVLVTQIRDGRICGFPLKDGVKCTASWRPAHLMGSVDIPGQDTRCWLLVDAPYDDVSALLGYDTEAAETEAPGQERHMPLFNPDGSPADDSALLLEDEKAPAGEAPVFPSGRHEGESLVAVCNSDPGYIPWVFANDPALRDFIISNSKSVSA